MIYKMFILENKEKLFALKNEGFMKIGLNIEGYLNDVINYEVITNMKILNFPRENSSDILRKQTEFNVRQRFIEYSYVIPSIKAVFGIMDFFGHGGYVISICSGRALFEQWMQTYGMRVYSTDIEPPINSYMKVEQIDGEQAVIKYNNRKNLFASWTPLDNDVAYRAVKAFTGDKVAMVVEGKHGCIADDKFFDYMEKYFDEDSSIDVPTFAGLHDYIQCWTRKIKN